MIVFMNEYYTKPTSISGVPYYMMEMMQFLKDKHNIHNIKELVNPLTETNRNIVHSRYTYTFDTITSIDAHVDKLFVSMNSLLYLLQSKLYDSVLHNVDKIYLLNANGILELLKNTIVSSNTPVLSRYKHITKKMYLLHEPGFENDFYIQSNLKTIPIIRGLYFNNFKEYDIHTDMYFMFIVNHITTISHTEEDMQKAQTYCIENNITYTTAHTINPAQEYKGLIYFRYHDYMPRLPYEFWYYNKDVKLLKVSDGLQKRMDKYNTYTFDWNLDGVFE